MSDYDQLPPQDLDAERAVLGAMMESERYLLDARDALEARHFYAPKHGSLFDVLVALHEAGEPTDHIAVLNRLMADGLAGKITGPYLLECQEAARPSVEYYAAIVVDRYRQRRLIEAGTRVVEIARKGAAAGVDTDEVIDRARAAVDEVSQEGRRTADVDFESAMWEYIEEADSPLDPSITTGIRELDDQLGGGLRRGQFVVVGARPGMGKSVLGVNIATAVASAGYGVLFASLEMSRMDLMHRVFASIGDIDHGRLRQRKLTNEDAKRRSLVATQASGWALRIDDTPHQTLASIRAAARDLKRTKRGLGVLVVDYIQLMGGNGRQHDRRDLEIGYNTRGLTLLAKELDIAIVALCQVNRGPDKREDKRPGLSDLRESGSIENDADIVILIHRDLTDQQRIDDVELIVAKHRGGPTGVLELFWSGAYQRITGTGPRLRSVG